jgi:ribosomal protein L37AE/L43A
LKFKDLFSSAGIEVEEKSEYKTSSKCPSCRSENVTTKERLFKCLDCELEASRDSVFPTTFLFKSEINLLSNVFRMDAYK